MSDTRRAVAVLWDMTRRAGAGKAATALALSLGAAAGFSLVSLWLKLIVDGAARDATTTVVAAALALAFSISATSSAESTSQMLLSDLHESCGLALQQDLMRVSGGLPGIEHHERPDVADRIAILRTQLRELSGFLPSIAQGVALVGRIGFTATLLASVRPELAALGLLGLPSLWAGKAAERINNEAREATAAVKRREAHLLDLTTSAATAREVRVFGIGPELERRRHEAWSDAARVQVRAFTRATAIHVLGWLPFAAGYVTAVAWVVSLALRGAATAGDLLLVVTVASQVSTQVGQTAGFVSQSAGTLRAVRRYLWLLDYAGSARERAGPAAHLPVPAHPGEGIRLDNVWFRYPGTGADAWVLAGVDLRLPAGSTVAIVGENGAGKTTLVKLLCRYYEPTSGRISVAGTDLAALDVVAWRGRITGTFQDFVRFELRLSQSVGVGDVARVDDRDAAAAALERAEVDLGLDLDVQLGREWDGGVELSEGQWQRVALARSMMRGQSLLVVLDEPTSGLDAHAEHALFERMAALARSSAATTGAVTVFVSHRFSTVRMADHIVVLDAGRVVAQGNHRDLVAGGGLYAELYGIQARAYAAETLPS